jgi:hypothetical protein
MKNLLSKVLVVLAALGISSQAQAWTYSFTNHTDERIIVGMRYRTAHEWVEFLSLEPHEGGAFTPARAEAKDTKRGGLKYSGIGGGKSGYVASEFYYIDPARSSSIVITHQNQNTLPWRAMPISWIIDPEAYAAAIEIAESVGQLAEAAAKAAAKAGAAYASGGATLAADAAAAAADNLKEAAANKVKEVALTSKSEALKEAASGDYGLGKFLGGIVKSGMRSLMTDRHIDIIKDETGKISFISLM